MKTTITITTKRTKTFKDVSVQCERIITMHLNGFGTDAMLEKVEEIFFNVLKKHGY